jgi:ParB family chromosome partitioning protein
MTKKRALGRGLSALLEHAETDITSNLRTEAVIQVVGGISTIPVDSIEANPFQPRNQFQKEPLLELAESIKEHGVIQPVTVRKMGRDRFQLISGERRFRASQIAGLIEIPAYIRIANDQAMLEMALVENIQRVDLNSLEVALSYQRLIDECNLTQEKLSAKVGKKRSTVTNYLRLLKLSAEVQLAIINKEISMGHARAILSVENEEQQRRILNRILKEDLSVRQTEDLVRGYSETKIKKPSASKTPLSFGYQKFKEDLSLQLKHDVKLQVKDNGNGKIEIAFKSLEELNKIIEAFEF